MQVSPIKTRPLVAPQDDLIALIDESLLQLQERDILCITSKVLSIHERRTMPIKGGDATEKDNIATQESEMSLPRDMAPHEHVKHTITQGNLASSAGIDTSNGNGHYILWPENPSQSAKKIATYLKEKYKLSKLAVIITDSRSMPLRYGATGYAIGGYGLRVLNNYAGTPDLFDNNLKFEQANIVDAIAAAAVLTMGEGSECTPLCLVRDIGQVHFDEQAVFDKVKVPFKEDMYYPFLKLFEKYTT